MKVIEVDMSSLKVEMRELPETDVLVGGRLFTSRVVADTVPPTCNPLAAKNVLVLANGPLSAAPLSSVARMSVGGKSPLTKGIKESNVGGTAGYALAAMDIRGIIVRGKAAEGGPYVLCIRQDEISLLERKRYRMLGTYECSSLLRDEFGADTSSILIGPAGELGLAVASVNVTDEEGYPGRVAARGGLGAVMGSKGLKAIVIEKLRSRPDPRREAEFREHSREFSRLIRDNRICREVLREYGTPSMVSMTQALGALPVMNFRKGSFEFASEISGEAVRRLIEERNGKGKWGHACMRGCLVRCSNVFPDADGSHLVAPLEYETIALLGSNLCISDLDVIARLNRMCNDIGMDTIEVGAALGVALEAGIAEFGDGKAVCDLVEEIRRNTPLGRVLGSGAQMVGDVFGVERIPSVKGQSVDGYDPRAVKGTGVTYATTPMGGDHTAGLTIFLPLDHHQREGQVKASRDLQILRAAWDALGFCNYIQPAIVPNLQLVNRLLESYYDVELPSDYLIQMGREIVRLELEFNEKAGLSLYTNRLPDFFREEPLPPHHLVFDVPDEELVHFWDSLMGR